MSDIENTNLVKDAYSRFQAGDVPGLLNNLSDDVEWTTPDLENTDFGGTVHGKDGVAGFFTKLAEAEDFSNFEPKEFIASGNRVVVLGTATSTAKNTGREYTIDWVHIFGVHDSKVTQFIEFFDTAVVDRAFQKVSTA